MDERCGVVARPMALAGRLTRWLIALSMLMLAGCAAEAPVRPPSVRLDISAAAGLNPDPQGRASPVVLRVYELTDPYDFQRLDFFELCDHGDAALGKAGLARIAVTVRPGQRLTLLRDADPKTRFLGVAVAYREIDRAAWQAVAKLPESVSSAWKVTLGAHGVTISRETASPDTGLDGGTGAVKPFWTALPGASRSAPPASEANGTKKENHVLEQ